MRTGAASSAPPVLSQSAPPGHCQRARTAEDSSDGLLVESTELRPRTCPILSSQFHWNLNAHAVESLSEDELAQVYRLFRFYDSSVAGDSLPSVNCRRFLQMLRDGRLLSPSAADQLTHKRTSRTSVGDSGGSLDVSTAEKIFAEAVMGKLRTYLDADGQPVLTFHLFCGALMNCAMTAYPTHHSQPETAMVKLLEKVLASVEIYAEERQREQQRRPRSLLQHFPKEGLSALWSLDDAHSALAPMSTSSDGDHPRGSNDFRTLKPFEQVLASFSHDVVVESRARERSQQRYAIPGDLAAHFTSDNLNLVVERFKLFDVFNRGSLPRQEILPLLTVLVKKLEISDMYEVLALLLTGEHFSRYGSASTHPSESSSAVQQYAEISLVEILRAIHSCRRSRTASLFGSTGSSQNAAVGKKAAGSSARKSALSTAANEDSGGHVGLKSAAESSCEDDGDEEEDEEVGNLESGDIGRRNVSREPSSRKPQRKNKAGGLSGQLPAATKQGTARKLDKKAAVAKKSAGDARHKPSVVKEGATDAGKASTLPRQRSKQALPLSGTAAASKVESNESGEPDGSVVLELRPLRNESSREAQHLNRLQPVVVESSKDRKGSFKMQQSSSTSQQPQVFPMPTRYNSTRIVLPGAYEEAGEGIMESSTSTESTTRCIRVFLLLGGDHDGAICYSVQLTLPQRDVEETRGIFSQNEPHEVLERVCVLPRQPDVESALLMLKKRVEQREREGFVLHPLDQLKRVETMLTQIRQHNPHYQSSLRGCSSHEVMRSRLPTPAPSPDEVRSRPGSELRSLDRAATCVRQRSASDLLVELSDSFTHQSLKAKKKCAMVQSNGDNRPPKVSHSDEITPAHTLTDEFGWIHSVGNANRSRERLLRSSASMPVLSRQHAQSHGQLKYSPSRYLHKPQKTHQKVQLFPA